MKMGPDLSHTLITNCSLKLYNEVPNDFAQIYHLISDDSLWAARNTLAWVLGGPGSLQGLGTSEGHLCAHLPLASGNSSTKDVLLCLTKKATQNYSIHTFTSSSEPKMLRRVNT